MASLLGTGMSVPGRDFMEHPNIYTGSIQSPSVTQHLPPNICLYTHKENGALVPSPAQPKATLTRAKERLGPQGDTYPCSEKGASVIPGWQQ